MRFAYCVLDRERPAGPSARVSKFVIQRGTLGHELRKPKGTSNFMILVPLFDLKFLRRTRGTRCRNFKSAALGSELVRRAVAADARDVALDRALHDVLAA